MLLTVFTPAYNRANTFPRLFESLINQPFCDFEWLIVDDGSTDDTDDVVKSFNSNGRFPIRYIKKKNGGKHTAHNVALEQAKGELFFTVDSDDWILDNSLTDVSCIAKGIMNDDTIGGIVALKEFPDGSVIGKPFSRDNYLSTFRGLELSGEGGERSIILKTKIARKYPFPVIEGERFMTEGVIYDMFSDYTFFISNKCLTICEYQTDGLSSNPKRLMVNNPGGYMEYYRHRIDIAHELRERISYILRYNFFHLLSSNKGCILPGYRGRHELLVKMMKPLNIIVKRYYNL